MATRRPASARQGARGPRGDGPYCRGISEGTAETAELIVAEFVTGRYRPKVSDDDNLRDLRDISSWPPAGGFPLTDTGEFKVTDEVLIKARARHPQWVSGYPAPAGTGYSPVQCPAH